MAGGVGTAGRLVGAARDARRRRADRRAVAQFQEFWTALQHVGNALAEAEKLSKKSEDGAWRQRNTRHWALASTQEIRSALRGCRGSLRVMSSQAKRFEPQLIAKEWRR